MKIRSRILIMAFAALGFQAITSRQTLANGSCDINSPESKFAEESRVLRLRTLAVGKKGQLVDVAVRRSNGQIEIYRGLLGDVLEDGMVLVRTPEGIRGSNSATDLRAVLKDDRPHGLIETRPPLAPDTVDGRTRGSVVKAGGHRVPFQNNASGEIVRPNTTEVDIATLPPIAGRNGRNRRVTTSGAESYVTYEGAVEANKVSRIWRDEQNVLHIEVVHPPINGKGWRRQELSSREIATLVESRESVTAFSKMETGHERWSVHDKAGKISKGIDGVVSGETQGRTAKEHDRLSLISGEITGTRGTESYVSYPIDPAKGGGSQAAKISRIWQDGEGRLHVEVLEPRADRSRPARRELSETEINSLKLSPEAEPVFSKWVEATPAPSKPLLQAESLTQHKVANSGQVVELDGPNSYLKYQGPNSHAMVPVKVLEIWHDEAGATHIKVIEPRSKNGALVRPEIAPPLVRELTAAEISTLKSSKSGPTALLKYEEWVHQYSTGSAKSIETIALDNLGIVQGPKFNQIAMQESIGGNAQQGHLAVNFIFDQSGRIVEVGNIQNFPPTIRKDLDAGILQNGTFRIKAFPDGQGKNYEYLPRRGESPHHLKVMTKLENLLNQEARGKGQRLEKQKAGHRARHSRVTQAVRQFRLRSEDG